MQTATDPHLKDPDALLSRVFASRTMQLNWRVPGACSFPELCLLELLGTSGGSLGEAATRSRGTKCARVTRMLVNITGGSFGSVTPG